MVKKMVVGFAMMALLAFPMCGIVEANGIHGGVVYGTGSGAQKNTSLAVFGSAAFEVFPKFLLEADGLLSTARTIGGTELTSYQSLTQQVWQVGASYRVEEDSDFQAYAGGGIMVFSHQYRSGESGGANDNVSTFGPYAKLGVQASPETNITIGGQVAYSPWASGGPADANNQATLMRLSGFLNYFLTENLSVQGTVIRTSHNQTWGLSTTWFGLGVGFSF